MSLNLSQRARFFLLFCLVLTPVVGISSFLGIQSFVTYSQFANGNSESTTGIIVDNSNRTYGGRAGYIYYPTIRYVTKAGNTVIARDEVGTQYVDQGQSVDLLYRREDTTHVILATNLDSQKSVYEVSLVIIIVALLVPSLLLLFFYKLPYSTLR